MLLISTPLKFIKRLFAALSLPLSLSLAGARVGAEAVRTSRQLLSCYVVHAQFASSHESTSPFFCTFVPELQPIWSVAQGLVCFLTTPMVLSSRTWKTRTANDCMSQAFNHDSCTTRARSVHVHCFHPCHSHVNRTTEHAHHEWCIHTAGAGRPASNLFRSAISALDKISVMHMQSWTSNSRCFQTLWCSITRPVG